MVVRAPRSLTARASRSLLGWGSGSRGPTCRRDRRAPHRHQRGGPCAGGRGRTPMGTTRCPSGASLPTSAVSGRSMTTTRRKARRNCRRARIVLPPTSLRCRGGREQPESARQRPVQQRGAGVRQPLSRSCPRLSVAEGPAFGAEDTPDRPGENDSHEPEAGGPAAGRQRPEDLPRSGLGSELLLFSCDRPCRPQFRHGCCDGESSESCLRPTAHRARGDDVGRGVVGGGPDSGDHGCDCLSRRRREDHAAIVSCGSAGVALSACRRPAADRISHGPGDLLFDSVGGRVPDVASQRGMTERSCTYMLIGQLAYTPGDSS